MEDNRFNSGGYFTRKLWLIIVIALLISPIFPNVSAKHKEYDTKEFQESYSIPPGEVRAMDFDFQEGEPIEIVYTVSVKEELPVYIWFVTRDNYMLLSSGLQFIHLIDGAGQGVPYAKRVISLTKYDNYKLALINYNNQTIGVDVAGEIRESIDSAEENPWELYTLIIIIIILAVLLCVLGFKIRKYRRSESEVSEKNFGKKNNSKKGKGKEKGGNKKVKNKKEKKGKAETVKKVKKAKGVSVDFCGHCGAPVDTTFCKSCGRKV